MAGERSRLQVLKEIEALEKKISDFKNKNDMRFKKNREEEKKQYTELRDLQKESNDLKLKNLSLLANEEKSVLSISNSFGDFKQAQQQVLDISKSLDGLKEDEVAAISAALEISRDLSDLTVEDKIQIEEKNAAFLAQIDALSEIEGFNSEILQKLKEQNKFANTYAAKTKEQKELLSVSERANEQLKQQMMGFAENVQTALIYMSSLQGIVGLVLVGLGKVTEKAYELNKTFGTVGSGLNGLTTQTLVLGAVFENVDQSSGQLAANLGGTEALTNRMATSVAAIANNMGIGATESADLVSSFMLLNAGSEDTALNLVKSSQEFAKQNGIIPAQLMGDLAKSTEQFALFGESGGENIIRAAGYARKLGVEMSQISGIADNLLDFETSITKELELSAMLGRNINLQKARQLAFDNDLEGATKEVLRQVGGINEFEKMNYYQRKQTADLIGVSVGELQKMLTNQGKANDLASVSTQEFSAFGETLNSVIGQFGPGILKVVGGFMLLRTLATGGGGIAAIMGSVATGVTSVGTAFTTVAASTGTALATIGTGLAGFFTSLATGLATLANPATLIGLAAVSLGIMSIGFSLALAAPAIEAFGNVISSALAGVASIATAIFGGLTSMLSVITLEKAASVYLLGAGFITLAAGIGALGIAAFFGGGAVTKFLTRLNDLDTSKLSQNAQAVKNFAQGIGQLSASINSLDTEKLEKIEDVSISLSVGGAISNIGSSVSGLIDSVGDALFGGGDEKNTQDLMLAELVAIKEHLATPRVVQIDREKAGQEFAKATDSSAKNVSSMDS